jgi:hypothetical protein
MEFKPCGKRSLQLRFFGNVFSDYGIPSTKSQTSSSGRLRYTIDEVTDFAGRKINDEVTDFEMHL